MASITTRSTGASWQAELLRAIGAPETSTNVLALSLWANSEGVSPKNYNPLAITDPSHKYPHAGVVAPNGGNPVYAFPTQETGVAATADFLSHGYSSVISAFQSNAGLAGIFATINKSRWCAGCQGGRYPVQLAQAVNGGAIGNVPTSTDTTTATDQSSETESSDNRCLLKIPGFKTPGPLPDIDGACLFYESNGRAVLGSFFVVLGAVVAGFGLTLMFKGDTAQLADLAAFL